MALLAAILGEEIVSQEQSALREIAQLLDYLPLRPSHFRLIPFLQSFAREKAANNSNDQPDLPSR